MKSLQRDDLLDELGLLVHPVIVGRGKQRVTGVDPLRYPQGWPVLKDMTRPLLNLGHFHFTSR